MCMWPKEEQNHRWGRGLSPSLEGQTALSQQEMEVKRVQRKEEAVQGLFAVSIDSLLWVQDGELASSEVFQFFYYKSVSFLPLSLTPAVGPHSIWKERKR